METRESRKERMRDALRQRIGRSGDVEDEEIFREIDSLILEEAARDYLTLAGKRQLRRELFNEIRRLDLLQELVDDDSVTEIMVNGTDGIFLERDGHIVRWEKQIDSREKLEDLVQQIAGRCNRIVNEAVPIADARLEDGSRVHIVLPPVALDGPVVTIRKFPEPITMEKLIGFGAVTEEAAQFLEGLVAARYNIFVSGGTNSGKTTFLNALSSFIPRTERVITIEDSAELQISQVPNLVRLETRDANTEGKGQITISQLIRASLRMNPDRIIVGEVRGAEALDMLQAMNTGHPGSLSTGHSNSARDMLNRLETMVLMGARLPLEAVRSQIASALDILVHLGRLGDGSRKVLSIVEVRGISMGEIETEELYRYDRETGRLEKTGELKNREKLGDTGNC